MSKALILVKYSRNNDNLYEEDSQNIDTVDVSDFIANKLNLSEYQSTINIFESPDSKESNNACVLDNTLISSLFNKCEELSTSYCTEISNKIINDKKRNETFDQLTMLLNIRKLIFLKLKNYSDDSSVYVNIWG